MNGKWELSDNHILMIQAKDPDLRKFTFHLIFDLKSTHRGRHNKLTWIGMLIKKLKKIAIFVTNFINPFIIEKFYLV